MRVTHSSYHGYCYQMFRSVCLTAPHKHIIEIKITGCNLHENSFGNAIKITYILNKNYLFWICLDELLMKVYRHPQKRLMTWNIPGRNNPVCCNHGYCGGGIQRMCLGVRSVLLSWFLRCPPGSLLVANRTWLLSPALTVNFHLMRLDSENTDGLAQFIHSTCTFHVAETVHFLILWLTSSYILQNIFITKKGRVKNINHKRRCGFSLAFYVDIYYSLFLLKKKHSVAVVKIFTFCWILTKAFISNIAQQKLN